MPAWQTSQTLFLGLLGALALQRLLEVRHSKRNEARILAAGGFEAAPGHFRVMQILHTLWFPAMILEVYIWQRPFHPWLCAGALVGVAAGQLLRYAALVNLGERWTVRIMVQPRAPVKQSGLYRYIRHPNYLGVILEFIAVPLLHSAYLTAALFSIANAVLLSVRIRAEEAALRTAQGSDYDESFGGRGRFLPF